MTFAPTQHAIVTGAASGIGLAVAERLAARGFNITSLDLQRASAGSVEHPQLREYLVDVTRESDVTAAISDACRSAGPLTHVVASHGISGQLLPVDEVDVDLFRRLLDIHVVGTLVTIRAALRAMEVRTQDASPIDRSIVTLSSTTAFGGWPRQTDYGVAKAAVHKLTQNLAIECAPARVRVNSVAPGHTLTPLVERMIDDGYDISRAVARTPLGRIARPEDIARVVEFLLVDASFVTGVVLPVDGGWTAVGN